MLEKLVDIINDCYKNPDKIEDYIIFCEDKIAKYVALVFKKYYKFELTRNYKENFTNIKAEKNFFLEIYNNKQDIELQIMSTFVLGEISVAENDLESAEKYFKECSDISYGEQQNLFMIDWAGKNLVDISDYVYRDFDENWDLDDIYKLEYVQALFKGAYEEDGADFNYARYIAGLWVANVAPNYKDILNKVFSYFKLSGEYEKLYKISIDAYKKSNNKRYIIECVQAFDFIDIDNYNQCYLKGLDLLKILKENLMLDEYSKLSERLFTESNSEQKLNIIKDVDQILKTTRLNSMSLKTYPLMNNLVKVIYTYIKENKFNNLDLNIYDNKFAKYLLYTSNAMHNTEELYESYTKLEVINEDDTEITSAIKSLGGVIIDNEKNLPLMKQAPFIKEFEDLKSLLDKNDELFEKINMEYLKYKDNNFYVMVYGIFSAGKSAFLNSLLGIETLEEGALPTTSTLTYISNKKIELLKNNDLNKASVQELVLDNEILNNITLIDTPGFEDSDEKRGALSTENFELANAFIILLDITKPLTNGEFERIKYLKNNSLNCQFIFVVNKIDFIDDDDETEEIMEYISSKLNELFEKKVKIYPYSAYWVKDGMNEYKLKIIEEIKNIVPTQIHKDVLDTINTNTIKVKEHLKENKDKKIKYLEININSTNKMIYDVSELDKFIEGFLKEYKEYFNRQYDVLKKNIDDLILEKMSEIVSEAINEAKNGENLYSDPEKIYSIVNDNINTKIKTWISTTYIINVSKIVSVTFENIKNCLNEKEKMINYKIDEVLKNNLEYSDELKEIYFNKFINKELVDEVFYIIKTVLKYNSNIDFDRKFVSKSTGLISGFKSLFKSNSELVQDYINDINVSYSDIVKLACDNCNTRMSKFNKVLKHLIKLNSKKLNKIILDGDASVPNSDIIRKNVSEEEINESNKNNNIYSYSFTTYLDYTDVNKEYYFAFNSKCLDYNVTLLDQYNNDNKQLLEKLQERLDVVINQKLNVIDEFKINLEKIKCIEGNINTYNNQLKRGIVYADGRLYRSN